MRRKFTVSVTVTVPIEHWAYDEPTLKKIVSEVIKEPFREEGFGCRVNVKEVS